LPKVILTKPPSPIFYVRCYTPFLGISKFNSALQRSACTLKNPLKNKVLFTFEFYS